MRPGWQLARLDYNESMSMEAVKAKSAHVARSALLVASLLAADKALGLVRDGVVSRAFGASAELDAYYAAFELPDGLFTVVAGSAMATSLIPLLTAYMSKGERDSAWRLASAALNWALLLTAGVSVLAGLFAPQVIGAVAPGFDAYRLGLAVRLMRLVLFQTLLFIVSAFSISLLQAHQHFLLPALGPLAYTLGRIGGALFLAPRWGIFGLAWGGMLGTLGHFLIQIPGLIRFRARWWPILRHPDLRTLLALMGPRMLGVGATYLNFVLPTFLGSRLPAGAISAYEYGWRLMQFPETIIGTALGLTLYPTLTELANAADRAGLRRAGGWALRLALALAIPAAAALVLVGRPLTALFLQRGAFDAEATARVYWALQFLALGLVGHTALEVVARFFYAQRDMWTPFWAALAGLAVNLGVGALFLGPLTHGSLALANSLGVCLQVALLLAVARARLGGLEERALGRSLALTLVATAAMSVTMLVTARVFPFEGLLGFGATVGAGLAVYLLAAFLLKHEVLLELPGLLRKG